MSDRPEKIRYPQIQKIWATARDKGISPDLVRSMTPSGSVGMLTKDQATILIDAMIKGQAPDYSQPPPRHFSPGAVAPASRRCDLARPSVAPANSRCPRKRGTPGIFRFVSEEQADADTAYVEYFLRKWRHKDGSAWTIQEFNDWMATRHYSHGGPMNEIKSSADAVERRELFKAMKDKTEAAIAARQRSAAHAQAATA